MKATRYVGVLWVAALLAAVPMARLRAHDLPLDVLMYVKAESGRLRVLVRLPPEFLRDAGLAARGDGYLDLQALEAPSGALSAVVSDVARTLDVMYAEQPLRPLQTAGRISPRADASFDTYESAAARMAAAPLPAEARINPSTALVDVQLDYAIERVDERLSIRVNGFRANRPSRMQVRYVTPAGVTRTLISAGAARRVELEPRWQTAVRIFATLGVEQLTGAVLPLLFLLALALPLRPIRTTLAPFAALAIGFISALTISMFLAGPPDELLAAVFQSLAAAVLAVSALQNITRPRPGWVRLAAAGFGVSIGLALGIGYRANLPLAGSHTSLSLLSFAAPILLGWLWLLLIAQPVLGLVHRLTPGRTGAGAGPDAISPEVRRNWAMILLSAVLIHAALHGIMVGP